MAQICVSLTETTTAALVDRMVDLAEQADLFEIRADLVSDLDLLMLLRAKTKPLVLTCRPLSEGGQWPDADPGRRLKLLEGAKRGFDYVDVELHSNLLDVMIEKSGRGLIVSYHDFEGVPQDLDAIYAAMAARGADIAKIAVTPRSIAEVGRFLDFAARAAAPPGPPLVPIAMGPLGMVSRVVAGRYGAPFTFACVEAGRETAPGQIPLAELAGTYRVREVTAATKLYGVVGTQVARSLSPAIHNAGFAAREIDAVYFPLQAEALTPFLDALPALGLSGFSVTRPFKVDILPHLSELDDIAALSGSVNTVTVDQGRLRGASTDGAGVVIPLKKRTTLKGRAVVILGAGGAARAAALALTVQGAKVTLLARDPKRAADAATAVGCRVVPLDELASQRWDVLINATPLGGRDAIEESPLLACFHRPGSTVLDMVYDPLETRLLREAAAAGCVTINGLEMLLAQAAVQFETWTGCEAPAEAMRTAALAAAEGRTL